MIWQRKVRIVLGVAGLGAATAVFMLMRERPVAPAVPLQPTDRAVVAEGGATVTTRFENSFQGTVWSYDAFEDYDDGSSRYWNVHLEFNDDGVEVWADEAFRHPAAQEPNAPRSLDLTGNVRFRTTDGLELLTPLAQYSEATGVLTMPDVVQFSKGRLTGEGRDARYDRHLELFRLEHDARLTVAPDADGDFVEATSLAMTMARAEQFLRLESDARIARPSDVLAAERATLYFVEETEELQRVDLSGRASVTPARAATAPPPEMHGDSIALTFHPDTRALERATLTGNASLISSVDGGLRTIVAPWIDVVTGEDGHTVTGLRAGDGVTVRLPATGDSRARTIAAPALVATGTSEAGLQDARFDGGVVFTEHASPDDPTSEGRTGHARSLTLQLDGDLDAIDDAEFRDAVRFVAGDTVADAELANYSDAEDLLVLHSVPGTPRRPHVEDGRVSIDAGFITLGLGGDGISASGDVRTRSEPAAGREPRPSSLFESGSTAIGRAPEVEYVGEVGRMTYRGTVTEPARLLQDDSSVEALLIELDDETGNLQATGSVVSTFFLEDEGDRDAPAVPYEISADTLEYDEQTRVATYRGDPVRMSSGEGQTEASVVVLTLAEQERRVAEVKWTGRVYALFEKDYEASGDTLHYQAATGRYVLRGQPAVTKFPEEDGTECTKQTGQLTEFNRETGEGTWPSGENRQGLSERMSCGKSIR